MKKTSFAHILFATGVPGKLFDKLRAASSAERPRPVGEELQSEYKDRPQDALTPFDHFIPSDLN